MTNSPDDLKCVGGTARPAPFVPQAQVPPDECIATGVADICLKITDNGDDTATYEVTYDGEAWVGLAVSPDGQMVGSQAVIGLPDAGTDPEIYNLNDRDPAGVVPAPAESQILTSSSIVQEDGVTVLTFTVPIETDGFRVLSTGQTGYLAAYGTGNALGTHRQRGA